MNWREGQADNALSTNQPICGAQKIRESLEKFDEKVKRNKSYKVIIFYINCLKGHNASIELVLHQLSNLKDMSKKYPHLTFPEMQLKALNIHNILFTVHNQCSKGPLNTHTKALAKTFNKKKEVYYVKHTVPLRLSK